MVAGGHLLLQGWAEVMGYGGAPLDCSLDALELMCMKRSKSTSV